MCQNYKQVFYIDEIRYLESNAHRTIIHTLGNEYVCYEKISEFEKEMGDSFVCCHQSFLVNMKFIKNISRYRVLLNNGILLDIARARYKYVEEKFIAYRGEV